MRTTLGQAAEVRLGRQRAPQYEAGDHLVPYLRSANVQDGELDLTDVKEMNFSLLEQSLFSLSPGDVLVTEGSGSRDTVGTSAVWGAEVDGVVCFQNTLLRLRPRTGLTDGRYLAWWIRHARLSGMVAAVSSGANILHIGSDGLKRLPLTLPSVEEQRRIADFLDERVARIDQIIAARRAQNCYTRNAAASALQELFDCLSVEFGEVRLSRALRRLEQGWSPQADAAAASAGAWGVMRAGSVNGGVFRAEDNKALPEGLAPRRKFEIRPGDLLMSRASGSLEFIGSAAVVPRDVRSRLLLPDKIYRLTPAQGWDVNFIAPMLRAHANRERIKLGVSGAEGMANNLPAGVVRALSIPNAPAGQQVRIADEIRVKAEGDQLLERALLDSIEQFVEYKQSLITAAVTGELDVTTASTRIPGE